MTRSDDQRALDAARAVALAQGLDCERAIIVHSASNVLVHLRPAPVLARVMTGTVVLHEDPRRWLEREVSVLEFLKPTGIAVAPSPLIAPGPWSHDGLWMTFSERIPDVRPKVLAEDAGRLGGALRTLHDELRPFSGDLGDLDELYDRIDRLARRLRPASGLDPGAIASLRARLDTAFGAVRDLALPGQPLHGDVGLGNMLQTPSRLLWNDFEDTFRGPVHWDVAGYAISVRMRGASNDFVREVLERYGWADETELVPFTALHDVYDEIWRLYDNQRRQPGAP